MSRERIEKDMMAESRAWDARLEQIPEMTLAEVRAKLEGQEGQALLAVDGRAGRRRRSFRRRWRSFPRQAQEWVDPVSRRGFLKVMGASMALAGLAGCTKQPDEPIYPYVKQPEDLILGKPMYFATAHPFPTGRFRCW
jgi:hypothetical protein